jgi:hypothetical protein
MKIGLIGAPGAGKDVVADFLVANKSFKKMAFADQIKKEYYAVSGYSEEQFKASRGMPLEDKIRQGLWDYSGKIKEKCGPHHFVDPVIDAIEKCDKNVVVSDVRTVFEVRRMVGIGAIMILVSRDISSDLGAEKVPGTQLPVSSVGANLWFENNYNTLEEAHKELENFYETQIRGEKWYGP